MSDRFEEVLRRRLEELSGLSLRRRLVLPAGIDFSSNDYLGLASDDAFQRALEKHVATLPGDGWLAPGSRLLRGHQPAHAAFEDRFAAYKGQAAALLFPSGYQANIGLLTALIGREDRVLSDELNHASLIDGIRLCRCHKQIFRHGDAGHVSELLERPHPGGRTFLVTESLFSMEGDRAPLGDYAALARERRLELIVDEAHATGLFGPRGAGLVSSAGVEDAVLATISTLGKAFALSGAVVTGSKTLIDYLVNRCRPFIFTTGVPPLIVAALQASLDVVTTQPERRRRVHARAGRLHWRLEAGGVLEAGEAGPILPVPVGDNGLAVRLAAGLQEAGFDVRAIRPPTVPEGLSRLRISVHASHTREEIDGLAEALVTLFRRNGMARVCV